MNISKIVQKLTAVIVSVTTFVSLVGFFNSEDSYDLSGNILYQGTGYDINAAPVKQNAASTEADFYVSPVGSDLNDGKTAATAFATLARARDAVR